MYWLLGLWLLSTKAILISSNYVPRGLCADRKLKNDVDCTAQLLSSEYYRENESLCTVRYEKTKTEACSAKFDHIPRKTEANLGIVELNPFIFFVDGAEYVTLINATFSDIKWTNVKFRFMTDCGTVKNINHCRELILSKGMTFTDVTLSYDCMWTMGDKCYYNLTYYFDYLAENELEYHRGRYTYINPGLDITKRMKINGYPFIYLDDQSNYVNIHINPIDFVDGRSKSCVLEVCKKGKTDCIAEKEFNISTKEIYQFNATETNTYQFKLICEDNFTIYSAYVYLRLPIGGIVLQVSSTIFAVILLIYILYKLHKNFRRVHHPQVLFIYTHIRDEHFPIVGLIKRYMSEELNWKIPQEKEIEHTGHRDPQTWCFDVLNSADAVLYFSDIDGRGNEPLYEEKIYANLDKTFLNMLQTRKLNRNVRVFVVSLGHSEDETIPLQLKKARKLLLIKDWNDLLHCILRNDKIDRSLRNLPYLEESVLGKDLIKAFDPIIIKE